MYGQILKEVDTAKYLGVLLASSLSWSPHIDAVATRANQKLGFIRRNLRGSPRQSKCMAYTALVRSGMEYASAIWDPHTKKDSDKLEGIQQKAARWATSTYSHTDSVTTILQNLKWADLADRRTHQRLTLLYKIINNHVEIQTSEVGIQPNSRPSRRHQNNCSGPGPSLIYLGTHSS